MLWIAGAFQIPELVRAERTSLQRDMSEACANALVQPQEEPIASAPFPLLCCGPVSLQSARGNDGRSGGVVPGRSEPSLERQPFAGGGLSVTENALRSEDVAVVDQEARGGRRRDKSLGD